MEKSRTYHSPKTFFILIFFITGLLLSLGHEGAYATDAASLLKKADNLLREAQRSMFSKKTDDAVAKLKEAESLINEARTADPGNSKIKTVGSKATRLRKDLERRTGLDLGSGAAKAKKSFGISVPGLDKAKKSVKSATGAVAGSSPKLPYGARQGIKTIERELGNMEHSFDAYEKADRDDLKQLKIDTITRRLETARSGLEKAKGQAAEKGITAHPKFDEIENKISANEKRLGEMKAGFGKAKTVAKARAGKIQADADAMRAEYDRLRPTFDKAPGVPIYYNDLKPAEKLVVELEAFEKKELSGVKAKLKEWESKYGTDSDKADKMADDAGYVNNYGYDASYGYKKMKEGIEKIAKTRTAMAEDLVKKYDGKIDAKSSFSHDFFRMKSVSDAKGFLDMAARFDSENSKVKEALSGFDARAKKNMADFYAKIDKKKWPGHDSKAPGNAKKLAKRALDYFKNDVGWGKRAENPRAKDKEPRNPVAVRVTGPWSVQKRNIAGEPVMYGLPVWLAVELESEKPMNVVRVYNLTLRTNEGRGVKKAPPFNSITVGDSWYMRPSALK